MSVELDPVELGFKRKHSLYLLANSYTKRDRPLPARGVADPPSQESSLGPRRIQGEHVLGRYFTARCIAFEPVANIRRSKPPLLSSTATSTTLQRGALG